MERKRNKLEVIRDMLLAISAKNGRIKPTQLLYKSNLSHVMMKDYIRDMVARGLVKEAKTKESRTYFITEKGSKYLSEYGTIVNFMESFGLSEPEES